MVGRLLSVYEVSSSNPRSERVGRRGGGGPRPGGEEDQEERRTRKRRRRRRGGMRWGRVKEEKEKEKGMKRGEQEKVRKKKKCRITVSGPHILSVCICVHANA